MGAPIHDPEGQVCGAIDVSTSAEDANPERLAVMAHIAFVIDGVLSQQRAAEMAKRKLAAKDRLLAEVSHELRTPLTAILGWTQVLKKRTVDELPAQALEIIERNALKQGRLIEDLLDVSRCLTGHLSIESSAVALGPLIKQAVDSLRQSADAKQQTLGLELEDTELTVIGDARRLDQVMSNLVGNAIKYTPEGGRIDVKLERVGPDALITVRDNGIGISPAFLPHIFDYFQRAQRAEAGRDTGLGLGLPIALEIVKLHHGVIEVHSDGEGRGATMRVRLPLLGGN
jgi:signal transduction histidine kinase